MNPFESLYEYEKWAIRILIITLLFFGFGITTHSTGFENPISELVFTYFLDSILNESTGDSGYNYVNTAGYGLGLALFVVSLAGLLRIAGIDGSDAMLVALIPWVLWAPFGEVIEDAGLFGSTMAPWFVSPGIHFQTAAWVVLSGFLGYRVSVGRYGGTVDAGRSTRHISAMLIAAQALIYCTSTLENSSNGLTNTLDREVMAIISIFGISSPYWLAGSHADKFDDTQRVVYTSGVGGSIVLFSILAAYAVEGVNGNLTIWPIIIVFGVPYLICMGIFSYGKEDARRSLELGFVPGVLPPGMTESDYLTLDTPQKKEIESLWKRGVLASPAVLLPVGGQIGDGIATWIGIDYFGYTEKHVISAMVTGVLDTSITFTIIKIGIAGVICWFYSQAVFEHRQQHLRILIALCLMVVGLAPALRNVFRLTLGV